MSKTKTSATMASVPVDESPVSRTDGSYSSFAPIIDSLIQYGHVTRGYLGVMIQDVTPALAKKFELKGSAGALVGDVVPKGPADKAGFKDGDVVLEYNGKKVPDSRHLRFAVGDTKPGTTVPVKILRDGASKILEVTVQQLPGSEQLAQNNGPESKDNGTLNGVTVSDLDQQTRQELKVPDSVKGAVITEVQPDSPAAEAGLKQGDVVQEINRHPVKTADEAVKLTENSKDKVNLLRRKSRRVAPLGGSLRR
jgi:serine protease Do